MTRPANPVDDVDELLSVHLNRVLPASRERVFEAWTSADMIKRWWGPESCQGLSAKADPQPGGVFEVEIQSPDGVVHRMAGLYTEVVHPSLVCIEIRHRQFEGAAERPEGYIPTFLRVELHEHAEGTELILRHSGFLDAALAARFEGGWAGSFNKLEALLGNKES